MPFPQPPTAEEQPCKARPGQTGSSGTLLELAVQGMQSAAFFLTDPQGSIVSWNSGAERILGYRDIEVSGHRAAYFFPEIETLTQTLQAANEARQELRLLNRHGRPFWVEAMALALRDEQGVLLGVFYLMQNISERKNAELALRESEARFRTLADVSPIMIWLNDEQANLIYANKGLLAFFGQPFDILAHRGWEPYIHPEDLGKVCNHLETAFETRSDFNLEFRMKQADGQFRWILSRGAARFRDDGEFLGQVGTCLDITEIREARETLESKVHERTHQLETLNKELEAFAYSVSHDLRAPLRSIDGFSQILMNRTGDRLTEEEQRYLRNVCDNTQRMGELIDDLLKLSRLSRAKMAYEDVDLGAMAAAILINCQKQEPQRHVRFQVAEGMVVHGDASLLKILLENLLGNAWKFTGKVAEAEIEVGVIRQGDKPVYYVKDNGAGFNMKYVDKLFGAFQRLHRMDEFPGTGIGLATVQRILHRHGGKAWAQGEVGKGATFYFSL